MPCRLEVAHHRCEVTALRIRLFGPFEVEGGEPTALGSRKARTLLKILALARDRPVSVDFLVDALWPEGLPARPAGQVAVLVSRLRGALGRERLPHSQSGYRLVVDWLDLDAVGELADEAARRLRHGDAALARTAAGAALDLVRGPLLADEPDAPWAAPDRAAAARLVSRVRHTAAEAALATAAWVDAAELGRQALDEDPYDEAGLRVVMTALASSGRPASALAAYADFRARLAEALGVDPGAETEAVHTAILLEQPVADSAPREQGRVARGDHPLPGRSRQLEMLDAALERATEGLEMVVVEGEAGVGKSRLMRHWAQGAEAGGATVLWGRCDELGRALPLQPVLDALRGHLRLLAPEEARVALGHDRPVVGSLLGLRGEGETSPEWLSAAEPTTRQAALFGALLAVLGRVGREPPVLVLEDVHLADASTLAWLAFATRRRDQLRALVFVTRRTGEGEVLPACPVIALGPLDLAATRAVVGPERAPELHARSGGNPLLLVELAAAEPGDDLPASVVEAVAARCARTGPAAPTLRTAAVIGPDVDLDLLAAVLSRPPIELLEDLEVGVRHLLLEERGARFSFRHELVREALTAGARASRRALIHREAGRALAGRPHADPLVVAYHAHLGGDDELSASALADAAQIAFDRHDHAEAERLLDTAVARSDNPAVRLQRARARLALGRYQAASEDAGWALARGAGAVAFEVAGWAAYYQRDLSTARSFADDGARLADDPTVRAACLALAGRIRHSEGDVVGADERLGEAVELAHGWVAPVSSVWLGALRVHQGRGGEALALLRPATGAGSSLAHPFAAVHAHLATGHALGLAGRASEALVAFDAAASAIDRQGGDRFAGRPQNYRAWVLRNLGAGAEAEELNSSAAQVSGGAGHDEALAHALLDLAEQRLMYGAPAEAAPLLDRASSLQLGKLVNRWRSDLRGRLLRARLILAEGAPDEALAGAAGVREDAGRLGDARYATLARLVEARSRAAAGERDDLDEIARVLERLGEVAGLEAWWLTAEVASALGVSPWWAIAERHLTALQANAGPYAEALSAWAGARLDRMRTTARSGSG